MVEQNIYLNGLFNSLADPVRRDILLRLLDARLSIGEIAKKYEMSFAAVAKHISILEKAKLVTKVRKGNAQIVHISPAAIKDATYYLKQYEKLWDGRYKEVDKLLKENI